MTDEFLNEVRDRVKEIDDIRKKLLGELQPKFSDLFKELFEKHDYVKAISWTQYIPSFNDGEPCEFSLGEVNFHVTTNPEDDVAEEENEDEDDSEEEDKSLWLLKYYKIITEEQYEELKPFENIPGGDVPEDLLESLFGVNVRIVISRDGTVETDEYDPGY